uniref:Peptide ABC transporter, permease protein n=1 Tax=uncultured bacterium A1Q1_fos_493 TaxID=1256577 RepID=L7VZD7_9BACT|nr:peptide ABC transporter, permease protein [uncultured bacterium A1Q1_fos_493]
MGKYILRRLLIAIPVLWGITLITFTLANLMPGDYVDALIPPEQQKTVSPEYLAMLRRYYGLDQPITTRYLIWLRELVLHGNLGHSYRTGEPVLNDIMARLPATLELTLTAMLFSLVVGTTLGIISAIKQYSFLDHLLTFLGFTWVSTPSFVFALLTLYLFSLKIPIFPTGGQGPVGEEYSFWTHLRYLFLPAAVLGLEGLAGYMRFARSSLLDVLRKDYITVARAKGLPEKAVYLVHALRNALLPLITIVGLHLPGLIGGAFIIETIFVWPGMGRFGLLSISARNYPVIMAMNLIGSVLVLLANLLADIAYAVADPRIRYEE